MSTNNDKIPIQTFLTQKEYDILMEHIEKEGLSIAQYTRFALMWSMVEDLNLKALKHEMIRLKDRMGVNIVNALQIRKEKAL